jgi:uncharacterized protein
MSEIEVTDNPSESRFEIRTGGELAGFADYRRKPGLIAFIHTEIDDRFEGQGLGSELARSALDAVRAEGAEVLPFCPFISGWIGKHPDYADLVPADQRERFGL